MVDRSILPTPGAGEVIATSESGGVHHLVVLLREDKWNELITRLDRIEAMVKTLLPAATDEK